MDALGSITWWGFSPALDLQDTDYLSALKNLKLDKETNNDELFILLVGAGDIRHVLTTVARSYRHRQRKIHFYILESALELYARDMLFLTIALETQKRMGLQDKTELFLELYGNLLVRKQCLEYVEKMSNEFIKMVTDFDFMAKKLPMIDMSQLKFKERDFLEGIFKFWRHPDTQYFDAEKIWDLRLRKHLGNRYDTRKNMFDWDLNMKLVYRDADIINSREYKKWREEGIAFDIREASYDTPNRTLASGMVIKHEGEKHYRRGYWGDIVVSPYVALGITCEDKSFFKKYNNVYTKGSQHIAEFNVLSMFHEITTKSRYIPPQAEEKVETPQKQEGPTITEIKEEDETVNDQAGSDEKSNEKDLKDFEKEIEEEAKQQEVQDKGAEGSSQKPLDQEYEALPLDDVKITFLPIGCIEDLPKKSKYKKRFNVVYLSNSMVHHLKEELNPIFADNGILILESARYMLELKDEQVGEFAKKVKAMAGAAGFEPKGTKDQSKENFFQFSFEKSSS